MPAGLQNNCQTPKGLETYTALAVETSGFVAGVGTWLGASPRLLSDSAKVGPGSKEPEGTVECGSAAEETISAYGHDGQ